MRGYLRLLIIFYKSAVINELEYRLNLWSNIVLSLFWLLSATVTLRLFFSYVDHIAGWTYHELLIVLGLFYFMNGYRKMLLDPNLLQMAEYIRMGTLDYVLTKPISSQFLVSLRYIDVHKWNDLAMGLGLVLYALWKLQHMPGPAQLTLCTLLTIAAMVLLYSLNLIMQAASFWLVSAMQLAFIFRGLLEAGRFPITFYRGWAGRMLTMVIPIALVTSFPAQALLGRLDAWLAAADVGAAILLLIAGSVCWQLAVRSYTSASS